MKERSLKSTTRLYIFLHHRISCPMLWWHFSFLFFTKHNKLIVLPWCKCFSLLILVSLDGYYKREFEGRRKTNPQIKKKKKKRADKKLVVGLGKDGRREWRKETRKEERKGGREEGREEPLQLTRGRKHGN